MTSPISPEEVGLVCFVVQGSGELAVPRPHGASTPDSCHRPPARPLASPGAVMDSFRSCHPASLHRLLHAELNPPSRILREQATPPMPLLPKGIEISREVWNVLGSDEPGRKTDVPKNSP